MFRYWLQGGRIDVGFLGAAEIDRFGNINTTVIGPYEAPKVRLPGAGGASEIAGSCREVFIVARQNARSFVEKIGRSEEHTSELQSLMRISYAVFCLKKKKKNNANRTTHA